MSDDKQFAPTAARLRKAQREGDVARSPEVCAVAAFGCGMLGCCTVVVPIASVVRDWLGQGAAAHTIAFPPQLVLCAGFMLIPATCAAFGSAAAAWLQTRSLDFSLKVSFERLQPAEGLKRMFSREALITAVRSSIAVAIAALALWPAITDCVALAIERQDVRTIAARTSADALRAVAVALAIGGVFSVVDFAVVHAARLRRLRMSFAELKRDHKEEDGDPHVRGRRSSLHRSLVNGSLSRVKDAAFVVTNPTHIAVALEYEPPRVPVPKVLVRAADDGAARVRALARTHGIPLVENVALARSLFATARPGEVIPREAYVAVAHIVASLARRETP